MSSEVEMQLRMMQFLASVGLPLQGNRGPLTKRTLPELPGLRAEA